MLPGIFTPRAAAPRLALALATSPMPLASIACSVLCAAASKPCAVLTATVAGGAAPAESAAASSQAPPNTPRLRLT